MAESLAHPPERRQQADGAAASVTRGTVCVSDQAEA